MSADCKASCPGVEAYIKAMVDSQAAGRRLDAHQSSAMSKVMCDNMAALKCSSTTKACQDADPKAEDAANMAMMECMCLCPKLATAGGDMSKICADKAGTVGCVTSTPSCATMAAQMNKKEVDLGCEYASKGCQAKMDSMMTCAGDATMAVFGTKCQGDGMSTNAAECCPIVKTLLKDCIGTDCNTITMAVDKMKADAGNADGKESVANSEKTRKACPDAGIPSEAAVAATASGGTVSDGSGTSADFAATGQTVSMLAMAAVIAGWLMA